MTYNPINNERPYQAQQLYDLQKDYSSSYDCLASHRLSAVYPESVDGNKGVGICFIRDPFDQFKSHYFYHRFHVVRYQETRDMTLDEYFEYSLVRGNRQFYKDWQYHVLTGRGLHDDDRPSMEKIRDLVNSKRLLLFPTESFDIACLLLGRLYPDVFSSTWHKRANVSKKDQSPSQGIRERFAEYSPRDYELLELAKAQLSSLTEKFFPESGALDLALERYRNYCRRAHLLSKPKEFAKRVLSKLERTL